MQGLCVFLNFLCMCIHVQIQNFFPEEFFRGGGGGPIFGNFTTGMWNLKKKFFFFSRGRDGPDHHAAPINFYFFWHFNLSFVWFYNSLVQNTCETFQCQNKPGYIYFITMILSHFVVIKDDSSREIFIIFLCMILTWGGNKSINLGINSIKLI